MKLFLFAVTLCVIASGQLVSMAQGLTSSEAQRFGLERAWIAQAQLPAAGGLVSASLWPDQGMVKQYAVVDIVGRPPVRVFADQLDANKRPIGMEKAKAEAQRLAARIYGPNVTFEVAEVSIPECRMVVLSSDGVAQCFDAENGKLLWATACGAPKGPAVPAALTSQGVLVLRGEELSLLDWTSGKVLSNRQLKNGVGRSVGVIDAQVSPQLGSQRPSRENTMVFVADMQGVVESIGLTDRLAPWSYRIIGLPASNAVALQDRSSIGFATNAGGFYVFSGAERPRVQYRFESRSGLSSSLAAGTDAFYIGDGNGVLTKISPSGSVLWRFNMAQPITSAAFIDNNHGLVLAACESGELTAIDDATGIEAWPSPVAGTARVRGIVASTDSAIFARTLNDTFLAIDPKSGQILGQSGNIRLASEMLVNTLTDRLYIADEMGQLQCYKPIGRDLPTISRSLKRARPSPKTDPESSSAPAERPADAAATDPFGASADPFGTDSTMPSTTNPSTDPLGDPFGGNLP
jgi:outer membrane protein assembly factor BamB